MFSTIVLTLCIKLSSAFLVLNKLMDTCNVSPTNVPIIKQDWTAVANNIEVKFNLCDKLSEKNYEKYVAYIKDNNQTSKELFETFTQGNTGEIKFLSSSSHCNLSVTLDCDLYTQEPTLVPKGGCNYNIRLFSPLPSCSRPCTALFNNRLIDFRELQKNYIVVSESSTFSVSLCEENSICGSGISSCNITDRNHTIPLSYLQFEKSRLDEQSHTLTLHGKTPKHGPEAEKIFEVVIKCNWYQNSTGLQYRAVPKQGRKYTFEIESSLGCVKYHECTLNDGKFFQYDLTKLYERGAHAVKVNDSRKIYLNLCGPLELPPNDNHCSKTSSQVCELNNNQYISKGRIYGEPKYSRDFITVTFIDGDLCTFNAVYIKRTREIQTSYQTKIVFKCSLTDEGPIFLKEEDCVLYIEWKTPEACPILDKQHCRTDLHSLNDTHYYNCKFSDEDHNIMFDDLNRLYNFTGHSYIDHTKNIKYLLNMCGPVFDEEYPCKTNSMVTMKFLNEHDIRNKFKFYGQLTKASVKNNQLIMETSGGDFCEIENKPYRSTIKFECIDKESEIQLISSTSCTLEFLWKTRHSCPKPIRTCVFHLPYTKQLLDFTNLTRDSIKLDMNNEHYLFDLCGNNEDKCKPPKCIYVPVNKPVITYNNKTHLEFLLNRPCGKNSFNKTSLELVCDGLNNNEHYQIGEIKDCTLNLKLATSRLCIEENKVIPISIDNNNNKEVPYKIENPPIKPVPIEQTKDKVRPIRIDNNNAKVVPYKKENPPIKPVQTKVNNCTVKNPYTGYVFNISSLRMDISPSECPSITFSAEKETVTLGYEIEKGCRKRKGTLKVTADLKCVDNTRKNSTKHETCFKWFIFVLPEACKLLETVDSSKLGRSTSPTNYSHVGAIIGYSVLAVLVLIVIGGLIYWAIRRHNLRRAYGSILMQYEKKSEVSSTKQQVPKEVPSFQ